jgi:hypothetical protein
MRSSVRHATRHVECHLLGHRVHDLCHRRFRCPARKQCQPTAARHMRREGCQHNRARGPRCRERSARTGGRAPSHWRHDWTAVPGPAIHPPDSVQARHREGGSTLLRDDHGRAGRDAEVGEFRVVDEGELRLALTERGRGGRLRQAMVRAYSCAAALETVVPDARHVLCLRCHRATPRRLRHCHSVDALITTTSSSAFLERATAAAVPVRAFRENECERWVHADCFTRPALESPTLRYEDGRAAPAPGRSRYERQDWPDGA